MINRRDFFKALAGVPVAAAVVHAETSTTPINVVFHLNGRAIAQDVIAEQQSGIVRVVQAFTVGNNYDPMNQPQWREHVFSV